MLVRVQSWAPNLSINGSSSDAYIVRANHFAWVLSIIVLPVFIVYFLTTFNTMDVATFHSWVVQYSETSNHHLLDLYKITLSNYPIVGNVISMGLLALIKSICVEAQSDFWIMSKWFRFGLSLFDALNGLLVLWFLSSRKYGFSGLAALLFVLSPSTWSSSGVWGQVEGFDQTLLFITLFSALSWYEALSIFSINKFRIFSVSSFLGVVLLLFTKQTIIFVIPYILVLCVYNFLVHWKRGTSADKRFLSVALCASLGLYLFLDFSFNLPQGFKSQLAFLWEGGGRFHVDEIAANGFNVWILLGWPMNTSSQIPILFGQSPKNLGIGLFLVASAYLMSRFLLVLKRSYEAPTAQKYLQTAHLILLISFSQIAFNLLLTSTHERYFYHFYPLFMVGLLVLFGENQLKLRHIVVASLGAVAYGLFVWSILFHMSDFVTRTRPFVMLAIQSYFLGFIIYLDLKISATNANKGTTTLSHFIDIKHYNEVKP